MQSGIVYEKKNYRVWFWFLLFNNEIITATKQKAILFCNASVNLVIRLKVSNVWTDLNGSFGISQTISFLFAYKNPSFPGILFHAMISAAVRTPYLRACLNQSRAPLTRKLLFNMSARTIVTTAEVPKVCYCSLF